MIQMQIKDITEGYYWAQWSNYSEPEIVRVTKDREVMIVGDSQAVGEDVEDELWVFLERIEKPN